MATRPGRVVRRARWTVPAAPAAVGDVRRRVAGWLEGAATPATARDDAVLVVSELLTNAIQASSDPDAKVRLELALTRAGCRITVADRGEGFPNGPSVPRPNGGRGLVVVRRLAKDLRIRQATGCTVVSALIPASDAWAGDITPPGSARSGP